MRIIVHLLLVLDQDVADSVFQMFLSPFPAHHGDEVFPGPAQKTSIGRRPCPVSKAEPSSAPSSPPPVTAEDTTFNQNIHTVEMSPPRPDPGEKNNLKHKSVGDQNQSCTGERRR